eukprot:4791281-Amphidinium_carterae.1
MEDSGGELMLCCRQATSIQVMDLRSQQHNAGLCMVKVGRHYYIHGRVVEGHATSVTVNRQNAKQITGRSDWRGIFVSN